MSNEVIAMLFDVIENVLATSESLVSNSFPKMKKHTPQRTARPKCYECGCKIRGDNHADGHAHKTRAKAKYK